MGDNLDKKKRTGGEIINNIAENVLFVLFSIMVVIVFLNVIVRFVFNGSIVESDELARYCFIWASLLGAVLALNGGEHIGVDMVVKKFSPAIQKALLIIANLFILIFTGICAWYGFILAQSTFGWPSPATKIPYGVIGLIVPISFLAMFFITVKNTIVLVRRKP